MALCLTSYFCCGAAAPNARLAGFLAAEQKFEEGRAGSADATLMAQQAFENLLAHDAGNPLYLAYYGSTFALQARDGGMPWKRIALVNKGIDIIDRALATLRPDHDEQQLRGMPLSLETRLVAVATYVALPDIFHRMAEAKQQLAAAMVSPLFATAPDELRGRLYYEQALIAAADGDRAQERRALSNALACAPASLDLQGLRNRLDELNR